MTVTVRDWYWLTLHCPKTHHWTYVLNKLHLYFGFEKKMIVLFIWLYIEVQHTCIRCWNVFINAICHTFANCTPKAVTRYHDGKLTFWLLWLTSTVMAFRWELFSPCRHWIIWQNFHCSAPDKDMWAAGHFLVTQHFGHY